jgi:hypothetical protein
MVFATRQPHQCNAPVPFCFGRPPVSMGNVDHSLVASMASTMASTMSAAESTMAAINSVIAHSQGGNNAIDVLMSMEDISPHYDPSHNFSRCPVPTCKHPGWSGKNRKVCRPYLATSFSCRSSEADLFEHCFRHMPMTPFEKKNSVKSPP